MVHVPRVPIPKAVPAGKLSGDIHHCRDSLSAMQGIAAVAGSTAPRFVERPEPAAPGAGQVLCRTLRLGICGTDREILRSAQPWLPPGEEHLVLGHECLARVEAVGPGVTEVATGALVVPTVRRARPGARHRVDLLSFGDFTERGIVCEHGFSAPWWLDEPRNLYRVPPELEKLAVLTEPLAIVEKGIHEAVAAQEARLGAGCWEALPPRVLATGLGPIGFAAAAAAIRRGWPTALYGRDGQDSSRARLAADLGARYVSGELATDDFERDGFDLVLECSGSDEVMLQAARALASRGVMVWLGSMRVPQPAPLNVQQLMRDGLLRNHLHIGSVNAAPRDFRAALDDVAWWHARNAPALARLITARIAPRDALWHYEHRERQGIKAVIEY
jgi:threonine dehydrogenase-like Zn-dependent dehydrogenase